MKREKHGGPDSLYEVLYNARLPPCVLVLEQGRKVASTASRGSSTDRIFVLARKNVRPHFSRGTTPVEKDREGEYAD